LKPIFEKLLSPPEAGFAFKVVRGNSFDCPWHSHSELELILVVKSGGYRMVGDFLAPLQPGDLVLLGPNLPHIYQNDEGRAGRAPPVHALVIQFRGDFLGEQWLRSPSLGPVRHLFQHAARGLHFTGATRDQVTATMRKMAGAGALRRLIRFLEILDTLAASRECRPLASAGFMEGGVSFDQARVDQVYQFMQEHLDQPLHQADLARRAHLSQGAFSRFFQQHTGMTQAAFVNELRVGRACQLLAESEMSVTEIAFACGFGNLSNFNRQFHRLKHTAPSEFRHDVATHALQSQPS